MRLVAILLVPVLLVSAFQFHRRKGNERRLAAVVSEVAGREVSVRCPGFWKRLVEITPYSGWVRYDAHGRPVDYTELSASTCGDLGRFARADEKPSFDCLRGGHRDCDRDVLDVALAFGTVAHESFHLRGVKSEAQTECYAVQTTELVALRLGADSAQARAVGVWVTENSQRFHPPAYWDASLCRPHAPWDLRPETPAWP